MSRSASETSNWSIVRDSADSLAAAAPVEWALEHLQDVLATRGISVERKLRVDGAPLNGGTIVVAGPDATVTGDVLRQVALSLPRDPEALAIVAGSHDGPEVLLVTGSDVRGLVYALLEIADRVACAANAEAALRQGWPLVERPANQIRSVTRLFVSDVEDKPWFNDRSFWQRYLTMLASHRFNRFSLAMGIGHDFLRRVIDSYFLFAYPFLVRVPGYDVRATGFSDEERDQNLAMLRFIGEEAKRRGLHFQLGLWTHGYEWVDSPNANYRIEGLTAENHAVYCRDAVRTLLVECPSIDGITFRVHGESGVPEGNYDFWRTVFQGVVDCGRPVELDLHPKGVDREMIRVALETGLPVNISPKFTAEHMGLPYQQASIREVERDNQVRDGDQFVQNLMNRSGSSLRYTRYGYADFLTADRSYGVLFRIWPGTQRILLWGDPAFAAGFGRAAHFGGCQGIEICEPLSFKGRRGSGSSAGRDPYADPSLRPSGGDWEKYLYTYRLFGRLLYSPDASPESWQRYLRHEFGAAAESAGAALARASRVLPLITTAHHPSAANNRFWPEMYTNMPIVDENRPHPYHDTPSPKRFGTVASLDPELFARIDEFADEVVQGERSGKYSPLRVARWLEGAANAATTYLADADGRIADPRQPSYRRLAIDVRLQSALARFFAQKLRAGVAYALFIRTGQRQRLIESIDAYRSARSTWVEAAEQATGVYHEDLAIGGEPFLRGHWSDRLPAIDVDLADMEAKLVEATDDTSVTSLIDLDSDPPVLTYTHEPLPSFVPGQSIVVDLAIKSPLLSEQPTAISLRYRRVNQADVYQMARLEEVGMNGVGRRYRATIPGEYTAGSPYALEYFFIVRNARGKAWIYPGFAEDLANQPYVVVGQAKSS